MCVSQLPPPQVPPQDEPYDPQPDPPHALHVPAPPRTFSNRPARDAWLRYQFYDAVQSWLVLLVVGFFIGLVAACLDIASDWSNDVKFGICNRGFWIPRHMCCRDSPTISECTQWSTWGQFFSSSKGGVECVNAAYPPLSP